MTPAEAQCRAVLTQMRPAAPLTVTQAGRSVAIPDADAYLPLLVDFTHEDRAAKGLRKLGDDAQGAGPAVQFTALEMAAESPALLLSGPRGGGKTAFLRDLARNLAGERLGDPEFNLSRLCREVPRNEFGHGEAERWPIDGAVPAFVALSGPVDFAGALERAWPDDAATLASADWAKSGQTLVLMIDAAERLGADGPAFLHAAADFIARHASLRVIVAGETGTLSAWAPPASFARHALLPLLNSQRDAFAGDVLARHGLAATAASQSIAAANPGLFGLALSVETPTEDADTIVDRWIKTHIGPDAPATLPALAFATLGGGNGDGSNHGALPDTLRDADFLIERLAAWHAATESADRLSALFQAAPDRWRNVVEIVALRGDFGDRQRIALARGLIAGDGDGPLHGALAAARLVEPLCKSPDRQTLRLAIHGRLHAMITEGRLAPWHRERAARILASWGDSRDLAALAEIPAGRFTMGSTSHPNSTPVHEVEIGGFRIGIYPVVNRDYGAFIRETGRDWRSPDGFAAERATAPATDLTWHDARAYCDWLTGRWRDEGRIGSDEIVRLPTEAEWERASRGDLGDRGDAIPYPWHGEWRDDAANSDEQGFNMTVSVGLFPAGRSPYRCFDMAGQVWEWCTTLWGDDMATPDFRYPYAEDGREALDAGPTIRRVLRGGCFSSGQAKACCSYRGSLEPNGFWRGNGFRIVVARG